jgi:hypothetical protein
MSNDFKSHFNHFLSVALTLLAAESDMNVKSGTRNMSSTFIGDNGFISKALINSALELCNLLQCELIFFGVYNLI